MLIRNVLLLTLCLVFAIGISQVYSTHAYVVWGLLGLCWVCYRLQLRAATLFKERSMMRIPVSSRRRNAPRR